MKMHRALLALCVFVFRRKRTAPSGEARLAFWQDICYSISENSLSEARI